MTWLSDSFLLSEFWAALLYSFVPLVFAQPFQVAVHLEAGDWLEAVLGIFCEA